uniref:Uncharacterized protein n=1 Tax=Leptocylindrus danicus TaxID=163516 RepID=A0A7S2P7W7_9STRA
MRKRIKEQLIRNVGRIIGTKSSRHSQSILCTPNKLSSIKEKWNAFIKCRKQPNEGASEFMELEESGDAKLRRVIRAPDVPYEAVDAVMSAYPNAVFQRNNFGRTILFYNNYGRLHPRLLQLLLDRCTPLRAEVICSALGHQIPEDVVRAHIRPFLPIVPLMHDRHGHTVLHYMIIYQAPTHIIQMLLESCPELIHKKTKSQRTPLHLACYCGVPIEMLKLLIKVYPDATITVDQSGRTPFEALLLHNAFAYDPGKIFSMFNAENMGLE